MAPIAHKCIVSPKSLLKHQNVFGTIDRGCSLTKLLYVKSVPHDETKVSLDMVTFSNKNFAEALDWLVARAKEEEGQFNVGNKKIRATGIGGERYKEEIESKLKMEVEIVQELPAEQLGAQFLVRNFHNDDFCYPDEAGDLLPRLDEMPEWLQSLHRQSELAFGLADVGSTSRLPAIFVFCGSGMGFNLLNEDNSTEVLCTTLSGGKTLMGMAKLIVGTNDYDELMQLAGQGCRGNVDTQAGEMFPPTQGGKSENSSAATTSSSLPPELPLFAFGKAADCDDVANFSKADLAASLLGAHMTSLMPQLAAYAKMHKIRRLYLGGHMFSGLPMRKTFNAVRALTVGMRHATVRFLSNGHTACIGCLLV